MAARRGSAGRTRTTDRERQTVLTELERSGVSIRQFARRRGIPAGTLAYWRHAAGKRSGTRPPPPGTARRRRDVPPFVELASVGVAGGARAVAGDRFELVLGDGRAVRIPSRFDAEALGRLLRVLAAPC